MDLDGHAFVAFYRQEAEMVLLFCTRRVFDAEVALDLTAEAFAQAYRGRRSFRGTTEAEARAWALTIARRLIARWIERGKRDRAALRRLAIEVPTLAEDEIAEIEARAGLGALLSAELARLNEDQRAALQLRVVEQRSYADVADALGVQEATARARVSRGRPVRALRIVFRARMANSSDSYYTATLRSCRSLESGPLTHDVRRGGRAVIIMYPDPRCHRRLRGAVRCRASPRSADQVPFELFGGVLVGRFSVRRCRRRRRVDVREGLLPPLITRRRSGA